jgi:hypothetical protein
MLNSSRLLPLFVKGATCLETAQIAPKQAETQKTEHSQLPI